MPRQFDRERIVITTNGAGKSRYLYAIKTKLNPLLLSDAALTQKERQKVIKLKRR